MKKYLFETEDTINKKRKFKRIKIIALSLLFFISFPLLHFSYTEKLIQQSKQEFFNQDPDCIVVFTGDRGRISKALELSKKFLSSKVLISGVYYRNNLQRILKYNSDKTERFNEHYSRIIDLDFEALNTYQNVDETLKYLNKDKNLKNILIISSDYHLPRIQMIINGFSQNSLKFHYQAIDSKFGFNYLYNIFKEHLKIFNYYIPIKSAKA